MPRGGPCRRKAPRGHGNVANLAKAIMRVAAQERFGRHFTEMEGIWNFATPEDTEAVLRDARFEDVRCWMQQKRVQPAEPIAFMRTVTLGPHLKLLPEELQDEFVQEVAAEMGEPLVLDYVRLNIDARRP